MAADGSLGDRSRVIRTSRAAIQRQRQQQVSPGTADQILRRKPSDNIATRLAGRSLWAACCMTRSGVSVPTRSQTDQAETDAEHATALQGLRPTGRTRVTIPPYASPAVGEPGRDISSRILHIALHNPGVEG